MIHPSSFKDLTGSTVGHLTVMEYVGSNSKGRAKWLCKCDCGNTKIVAAPELISGDTKSCGCIRWLKKVVDLTGERFGQLTVMADAGRSTSSQGRSDAILWRCKCDCGNERIVRSGNLRSGNTVSCGCYNRKLVNAAKEKERTDLAGRILGRITVVGEAEKNKGDRCWSCVCECGNRVIIRHNELMRRHKPRTSCGCIRSSNTIDRSCSRMVGRTFGLLTVLSFSHSDGKKFYWDCSCVCGNSRIVDTSGLNGGEHTSCGCESAFPHDGMNFRSRWELFFYAAATISGIDVQYERDKLTVNVNDSDRLYLPDFWLPSAGSYVEIKGFRRRLGMQKYNSAVALGYRVGLVEKSQLEQWCGTSIGKMTRAYNQGGISALFELLSSVDRCKTKMLELI